VKDGRKNPVGEWIMPVASIQIYFEGAKFFLSGRGTKLFPKPYARRAESGGGVLGEGALSPSPPARGSGGAL